VCEKVCVFVSVHVSVHVFVYTCLCECVCVRVCVFVCACELSVCVYEKGGGDAAFTSMKECVCVCVLGTVWYPSGHTHCRALHY